MGTPKLAEGHRARLRERFERAGFAGFAEHEILELLLTLCIPRKDVKPPAKMLLKKFGCLKNVLDASAEDLRQIEGIGSVAPVALRIIRETASLYLQQEAEGQESLNSVDKITDFWRARMGGLKREVFEVAYFDSAFKLLNNGVERLQEGDVDRSVVYPRQIMAAALKRSAAAIVVAHNHPSGHPFPSQEDQLVTQTLMQAADNLDIKLIDHIIIAGDGSFSFRKSGLLDTLKSTPVGQQPAEITRVVATPD